MNILEIIGERDYNKEKADALWQILVMLKRELDPRDTRKGFLQIPSSAWEEVVKRCEKYQPH